MDFVWATEPGRTYPPGRLNLVVPTLLFYEVMNALRFSGTFKRGDLVMAARSLSKYRFDIWRPRGKLLELSTELSMVEDLTVYDACYVALAQRVSSKVITEDKELPPSSRQILSPCPNSAKPAIDEFGQIRIERILKLPASNARIPCPDATMI